MYLGGFMEMVCRRGFLGAAGVATAGAAAHAAAAEPVKPPALKFRLGIVTWNIAAAWDVPTILKVCRAVGLNAVELRTTHKHGVEPALTAQQRKDVRQRFADAGIDIWGCGTICEFHSPDPKVVQQNIDTCRDFIRLVADIGGKGVKVRPNGLPDKVPVARTLDQIGRALNTCGRMANDHDVEIWLEVHGRGTDDPARIRTIMERADHPRVGITWNSNPADVV